MSETTQTPSLHIPKFQWDRLQAALRKNTRDFITDCANYIGTNSKTLLAQVQAELNKEQMPINFFESDETSCEAYCIQDRFAMRCRKPALLNTHYCHKHQYPHSRPNIHIGLTATKMKKLTGYDAEVPELWLEDKTNRVFNSQQLCVGFYDKESNSVTIFTVEDDADLSSRDGVSDVSSFHDAS
jgi:hypothetical protein